LRTTREKWKENLTIEHVAPREPQKDSWPESLYENPDLVDHLGNLTLLPKAENSSFGRRPWQEKRAMYRVLSSCTEDELETRLAEARNQGIQLSESTEKLLRKEKYFQHLTAICSVDEWIVEFVQKRSKRLAELVWRNIAPWLGFDKE